jgi:hypothetical protein
MVRCCLPYQGGYMASRTHIRKTRKKIKATKEGKARKRHIRIHGSTPPFPIHKEEKTVYIPDITGDDSE